MPTTCSARISTRWSPGRGSGDSEHARDAGRRGARERLPVRARRRCAEPHRRRRGPAPTPASGAAPRRCSRRIRRKRRACSSSTTAEVQADRVAAAQFARRATYNAHVVLKGNGSVLVARDGHWFINTTGNPGMASAGMGDVLAGILGALLAQRLLRRDRRWCSACTCTAPRPTRWQPTASGRSASPRASSSTPARRIWNRWLSVT